MRIVAVTSKRLWKHALICTYISEELERSLQLFVSFALLLQEHSVLVQESIWKAVIISSTEAVWSLSLEGSQVNVCYRLLQR